VSITAVNNSQFSSEVLASQLPVLVDFWAPWCPPCRLLAPELEKVADQFAGRLKVVKVNTEQSQGLALRYQVRGIPHLMVFHQGEPVAQHTGFLDADMLGRWLDMVLAKAA